MAKRGPVGVRELDTDVEDYRGLSAGYAGQRWAQDHPLPKLTGPRRLGLAEQAAMAIAMYETGVAAALLYGADRARLEAFWKHYLRSLGTGQ